MLPLQIPPVGPWVPPALHVPNSHTPNPVASSECTPYGGDTELWKMASKHLKKAGPNLQDRERPQTWALALPLGKQKRDSAPGWVHCRTDRKEYKFKNSAPRGSKKCGAGVSTEGLRMPQITRRADRGISLQSQSVETRGGYHYYKWKDSNSRLQGTWKIRETWYHQGSQYSSSNQPQRHGYLRFTL